MVKSKSERERQILSILTHTYGICKDSQMMLHAGSKGDPDIKNRLLDLVGERGGAILERGTLKTLYITIM